MSIRNQIIVLIILMTLLPLCIIAYTAVKQQQHDIEESKEMIISVANQIQNDQKSLLAGAKQIAAIVSILPGVTRHDEAAVGSLLADLVKTNPQITNIIIVDRTGYLWASAIPTHIPLSFADRRYFKNAVATGKPSSGEYSIGKISLQPNLSIAYPIKDRTGTVSDVMVVVFSLDRYNQLYSGNNTTVSSILLADHKGTILYSSVDPRLVGKQDRPDLFTRMTAGTDQGTFEANGNLGIRRIFAYRKLWLAGESTPYMYIRTGLDKEYVQAKAHRDLMLGAEVLLPTMLVMLGMAICFCRRNILNKVTALVNATQMVARGDLTARVPDHISGGELGELGGAFNDMAHRLQLADHAQRESENKYRELVENANCIILKWDNDGRVIFFNEFAETFFGFSGSEIIDQSLIGTIVPETESSGRDLITMLQDISNHPDAFVNNENENIRKNGERVWISWSNHALLAVDGSQTGILSIGQDITERKRIEKELRRSEQRFRSFVENANDVVFALTTEGVFSYVSPRWTDAFGYEISETIGHPFVPFVHPDDVQGCFEFLKKVIATGEKRSGVEYRVLCKDGSFLWYTANGSLMRDADSDDVLFVGIGRDITELKKAQETLRQSEAKFSAAFRASPDAITLTRLNDGAYLEVNEGYSAITGYLPEEVIGKTSLELNFWFDPQERVQLLHELHENGIVKNKETRLRRKDGSLCIGLMSVRIIEINGQQCLLAVTRDVTEREYLQNELIKAQKLESISILAGGIAHNFNNVLTGVIGYISYAKKHLGDPPKALQILESAEKSSYRAAGLARQLLTFSQGGRTIRKTVAVETLVEESVSLFLSGSKVKGTVDCAAHQTIHADCQLISQAFNNIVLNALHAMPDGGTLSVRVDSTTLEESNMYSLRSGDYTRIVFEDSGCGIGKADLNKVFDPYFSTKDTGTGLGLSTTHSIITKHGGHIDITSEIGHGTRVTVLLPSTAEDRPDDGNPAEQAGNHPAGTPILVMDDEEVIREVTEELLTGLGYAVTTCADGEQACILYRQARDAGKTFSMVILDLSIPGGMGGVETARMILDLDPLARLIASSGNAHDQAVSEYDTFGFCGSIAKPYNKNDLARAITRAGNNRPS
jgi:two-component system, cell cycle sensor histidine kinase and response regulator CckA